MRHYVFIYDGRDKNINSQTNNSVKYISNTYGDVTKNEIYYNKIMINTYFRVYIRIFIDERGCDINNYNN